MSLEDTTLQIGDVSFKGVWIAIVLGLGSTIGGGVWTASSLYSRLEAVESIQVPDVAPIAKRIELIEQELDANDVSQLQGKLAGLGVNLKTIVEQQEKLLLIKSEVQGMKQEVAEMKTTVERAELLSRDIEKFSQQVDKFSEEIERFKREIQDIWEGMDYLSNPLA